jgi:FAD/FMN-containing dehydrogenase
MVPDAVARPASEEDVRQVVQESSSLRRPITPAGGQTSTTGASITDRGTLLSMRAMSRIIDIDVKHHRARVEPGVIVGDLKRACAEHDLFFTPDPTSENECTVGGAIACNASGARSLKYGPTRPHVTALSVVLADGSTARLTRSSLEKNTVGYAFAHEPIDWFIGSEGTFGVIVEAEVALRQLPVSVIGLAIPFASDHRALAFVVAARESDTVHPRCLEFFDALALEIARAAEGDSQWAPAASAFVYIEEENERDAEPSLDAWLALAETFDAITDDVRVYDGERALTDARRIRHAVPSHMNERGNARRAHGGRKVSTDWAVPYRKLDRAIQRARSLTREAGLEQAVIYGHAGNGHPHQNFIANDADELQRIDRVVEATLHEVIQLGGTVAAEHGIGKLKRRWLPLQMTPLQVRTMHAVKRELDPFSLFSPGNIL